MKTIALIILSILSLQGFAGNYYISASGSDANPGTSIGQAWLTFTNVPGALLGPGDTLFLRSGDTFRGALYLPQFGNASSRLVITAYGSGPKPVISGAREAGPWTSGPDYFWCLWNDTAGNFFADNREQILARYPNDHQYLYLDSATTGYLKDAALTLVPPAFVNQARVCIHTAQWCWEKTSVAAFSSNQITYQIPTQISAIQQMGYFLYGKKAHLDTAGEWYHDNTNDTLFYFPHSGLDPNGMTCEVSIYENGIELGSAASYILIQNIAFEKQMNAGVLMGYTSNRYIQVDRCDFFRQYHHGVNDKGWYNEISNNYFREVDGIAVYVNGTAARGKIHHNVFRNIGEFRNSGIGTEINLSAIKCAFVDSFHIHHNNIDSTGYCGIAADGQYHLVERNIIQHAMLVNNDGAALKSYGGASSFNIFRNNFVSKSDGSTEGTTNANFATPAIYFDFNVNYSTIADNTIFGRSSKGIFINAGNHHNTITGNVVYGGSYGIDLNGSPAQPTTILNMTIKKNTLFARNENDYLYRQMDFTNAFNEGIIDSNYLFQPYDQDRIALRMIGATQTPFDQTDWQSAGNDINSSFTFVSWVHPEDSSELFMNPSDSVVTLPLSEMYIDLDSTLVCDSVTLEPYTSKVLIRSGSPCILGIEIAEKKEANWTIYPVPAMNHLFIRTTGLEKTESFQMMDMSGRIIFSGVLENGTVAIDLQGVSSGMYIIQSPGSSLLSQRIVKP